MTILSRLRKKYHAQKQLEKGIDLHTAGYYEMKYVKFEAELYVCFMSPQDKTSVDIKSRSILHTLNGEKIISIRKLDANNLAKSLTWNRSGSLYSRYQTKRKTVVRKKEKK